jgi:hypothetical protein
MDTRSILERAILILICVCLVNVACEPIAAPIGDLNPSYLSSYLQSGDYTFDPKTILVSLDQGGTNIFTPLSATPGPDAPMLPPGSLHWREADYLKVANALSRHVFGEDLDLKMWSVYYLSFKKECYSNSVGFDSFDITYFREVRLVGQKFYAARYIGIYPLLKDASWGGNTNFHRPFFGGWSGVNLTEYKVTADDAARIADEHGGGEARSSAANDCSILVSTPDLDNGDNWYVYYYPGVNFKMIVDPYTGKYKLLRANDN